MKVYIGSKIKEKSFGGGNQFAKDLQSFLIKNNVNVCDELESGIDILILTEPRPNLEICKASPWEINSYLKDNPETVVVHRINECDERKGTKFLNQYLVDVNKVADHTIFIASWLIKLFSEKGMKTKNRNTVVLNGANQHNFFKRSIVESKNKYKIVTHHWSAHRLKGWDIYEYFNELLNDEIYSSKFEFHYIGNVEDKSRYNNIIFHEPLSGKELGDKLREMDIYFTATVNEPAGMHHVEGAMCGLPVLYRESGALTEYCKDYGIGFTNKEDFKSSLLEMFDTFEENQEKVQSYNRSSEIMCQGYLDCFKVLMKKRVSIVKERRKISSLFYMFSFFKYRFLEKFLG